MNIAQWGQGMDYLGVLGEEYIEVLQFSFDILWHGYIARELVSTPIKADLTMQLAL